MFRSFFWSRQWFVWAWMGLMLIVAATGATVWIDLQINSWFGDFYNAIQSALGEAGSVSAAQYYGLLWTFAGFAAVYIVIQVMLGFFTKHWTFRWRTAMNDYYTSHWRGLRHIEGASQRVQEDTRKFTTLLEQVGSRFLESVMILIAFLPILWVLSSAVKELPGFGPLEHALVYVAILSAAFGTSLLALVGIKLPGLEFENQKVEAAYRKELVYGEDDANRAQPPTLAELFRNVRRNHFRLFFHYMYFDVAKWSYLQGSVIIPYIAMGPTILGGAITLGLLQQVVRAFGKVEQSFQFLVLSWATIVELMSVYKRLRAFETEIEK